MRDILELLDALDLVIARSRTALPEGLVEDMERSARTLRARRGFVGETLVLALAGGTGCGKSSLLNALAGERVASVSIMRPHTEAPLAWVPTSFGPGLDILLDDLGITERVRQDRFPGLAVIDLPDMDSIAEWHRRSVVDLLPNVDAVVWVFDPEKYRDRALHEEFLAGLADYSDQFVFVLNKIDRLDADELPVVERHLHSVLATDGFVDPRLFTLAAAPDEGSPRHIEPLASFLSEKLDAKRVATGKLVADAKSLLRTIGREGRVWSGASIDFEDRWLRVREASVPGLLPGSGPAARDDAMCRIEDFLAAVSVETGGGFGSTLRDAFPPAEVHERVEAAADAAPTPAVTERRSRKASSGPDARPVIASALDREIGDPVRAVLWERALFGATVAYAGVGAAEFERRLKRG